MRNYSVHRKISLQSDRPENRTVCIAMHSAVLRTIAHFTYSFLSVPFFISKDIE